MHEVAIIKSWYQGTRKVWADIYHFQFQLWRQTSTSMKILSMIWQPITFRLMRRTVVKASHNSKTSMERHRSWHHIHLLNQQDHLTVRQRITEEVIKVMWGGDWVKDLSHSGSENNILHIRSQSYKRSLFLKDKNWQESFDFASRQLRLLYCFFTVN